jgi:hypothetical protein
MRALALITMFFGWLVYSTMSAWAGCPTCASMNMSVQADSSTAHHHMEGMAMPDMAAKDDSAKDLCSTGIAHMPLCAACVVLPATATIPDGGKHVFAYPAPALDRALRDNRPAPQAPPPRFI